MEDDLEDDHAGHSAETLCRLWYHCSDGLDGWRRSSGASRVGLPVHVDQVSSSAVDHIIEQSKYLKQKICEDFEEQEY